MILPHERKSSLALVPDRLMLIYRDIETIFGTDTDFSTLVSNAITNATGSQQTGKGSIYLPIDNPFITVVNHEEMKVTYKSFCSKNKSRQSSDEFDSILQKLVDDTPIQTDDGTPQTLNFNACTNGMWRVELGLGSVSCDALRRKLFGELTAAGKNGVLSVEPRLFTVVMGELLVENPNVALAASRQIIANSDSKLRLGSFRFIT